jgi:hypothetical protein
MPVGDEPAGLLRWAELVLRRLAPIAWDALDAVAYSVSIRSSPEIAVRAKGVVTAAQQRSGLVPLQSSIHNNLCLNCACQAPPDLNALVRVGPVGLEPTTYGVTETARDALPVHGC